MASDTNLGGYFKPNGMEGGKFNNKTVVSQDTGGIPDNAYYQPDLLRLHTSSGSGTQHQMFPKWMFKQHGTMSNYKLVENEPEAMDCQEDVVNLKKSKKVLEPLTSPPVRLQDSSASFQASVKRKVTCVEETGFSFKSGLQRERNVISEVEKFVNKINQTAENAQFSKPKDFESMVFDSKSFSGNFKPKNSDLVGSGSNGQVFKFTDEKTGKVLMLKKSIKLNGKFGVKLHLNEVKTPLTVDSSNLAKVFGLAHDVDKAYIVMENAGINLRVCVQTPGLSEYLGRPLAVEAVTLDLLTAISHLAARNITHCDLKPENVCVDEASHRPGGLVAKVIDMASSQGADDPDTTRDFTPEYLDPAFIAGFLKRSQPRLTPADDVWAVGLIMLFVAWKGHPMILHHLGLADYGAMEPDKQNKVRRHVMEKIADMRELPEKFLRYPDRPVLDGVLKGALVLDKHQRLFAKNLRDDLEDALSLKPQRKRMRGNEPVVKQHTSVEELFPQGNQIIKMKRMANVPILIEEEGEGDYGSVMVDKKKPASQAVKMKDDMSNGLTKRMHGLALKTKVVPVWMESAQRGPSVYESLLGGVKVRPHLLPQHSGAVMGRRESEEMTVDLHSEADEDRGLVQDFLDMDVRSRPAPSAQTSRPVLMQNETKGSFPLGPGQHVQYVPQGPRTVHAPLRLPGNEQTMTQTRVFHFGGENTGQGQNIFRFAAQQGKSARMLEAKAEEPQHAPPQANNLPDFAALITPGAFYDYQ